MSLDPPFCGSTLRMKFGALTAKRRRRRSPSLAPRMSGFGATACATGRCVGTGLLIAVRSKAARWHESAVSDRSKAEQERISSFRIRPPSGERYVQLVFSQGLYHVIPPPRTRRHGESPSRGFDPDVVDALRIIGSHKWERPASSRIRFRVRDGAGGPLAALDGPSVRTAVPSTLTR